ncbi:MAG: permease-like cell division protein FtsX [bacterium]
MNRFLSFLIIFVSAVFIMLGVNIFNKINNLYKGAEFRVFLSEEANVDSLRSIIESYPGIDEIVYISKDEAMIEFNKSFNNAKSLLNDIMGNPFPASFKIVFLPSHYKNSNFIANLSSAMLNYSGVTNVTYSKKWLSTLNTINVYFDWLSLGFGLLLFCFLLFIVIIGINNNIIFYREEIKVLKDFGISNWKLKFRFGWKTLLWNVIFAVISIGLLYCGYKFIVMQYFVGNEFITVFLPLFFMISFVGAIGVLTLIVLLINKI